MGFIDSVVNRAFRDDRAGRVVVFSGDRRSRGYIVKSEADELRIKSFLRMFYFAHFSILVLGMMVANSLSLFLTNLDSMGSPAAHLFRTLTIYVGIYFVVEGLPYFFLWRSYKKAFPNFVAAQDEVKVSGAISRPQIWIGVGMLALGLLLLLGIALMVSWHA
jgi:hypothetical protein